MKKQLSVFLIFLLVLLGCDSQYASVKYAVAVSSDAEKISYSTYGAGETTLIFVHGWSCDSRYWHKQLSTFSKNYRVVTVDLAGHGHSSLGRLDYSMLSFAQDVKAVIEKDNINQAILIGHSMGGGVIAEVARLMPKKVVAIIGIDTLQNVAEDIPQNMIDEMSKPFEVDFQNAMQAFVLPLLPDATEEALIRWIQEDMASAPKKVALSAFRHYMGQYVNGEASAVFENISIPVVSINARVWPTDLDANKKHIQDYNLYYIEETGHFPMLEKPKKFNALLTEVLESIEVKLHL
ncbi:MAG: alpha/beta hydrolase [Methylococcales bacterium]|jgi:pimeloyl-ACP methyl ester carboxylesterase|nr:alpha/beta hydrolase [Methylococcales bacterium]MBT7444125.1 alpha/beta hydrolase [Methylococcales bacterium]